jgi:hypothetical protein
MHASPGDVVGLLTELAQLSKLLATEKRDLEVIRSHYTLEMQKLANTREEVMKTLDRDYDERAEKIRQIHERIKEFTALGQFDLVKFCMEFMMTDLGPSPLRQIIEGRNAKQLGKS